MVVFDGYTELFKSGLHRLRDAEELLEPPSRAVPGAPTDRHAQGAVYMSGYGVECFLKAYIIKIVTGTLRLMDARNTLQAQNATVPDICSAAGHKLNMLLALTDLEKDMDERKRKQFGQCAKWHSTLRYDPRPIDNADAVERVEAAREIVNWIKGKL